jgi:hypothetical protein
METIENSKYVLLFEQQYVRKADTSGVHICDSTIYQILGKRN